MDNTSTTFKALDEMLEELESELSTAQSRIAALEKSGKDLISYIEILTLEDEPPDKTQKEKVIKAIQVIWNIPYYEE